MESEISAKCNVVRRGTPPFQSMDISIIKLVFIDYGGSRNHVGNNFRKKGPTWMRLITGLMRKLETISTRRFIKK